MLSLILKIIAKILAYYVLFTVVIYFFSLRMIFAPPPSSYTIGGTYKKITLEDKSEIGYIYLQNPNAQHTILYSHGNAEDIGLLEPLFRWYYDNGYSVFAYDYPGYGVSTGFATESGSYKAITASYNLLLQQKVEPENIILLGRSLGSGPALFLAERHKVGGIILEAPFVSTFRVMTKVTLLPVDRFNNLKRIKNINTPIVIIHGVNDEVVPFWHGKELYDTFSGKKYLYPVDGAMHNNLLQILGMEEYKGIIGKFINDGNIAMETVINFVQFNDKLGEKILYTPCKPINIKDIASDKMKKLISSMKRKMLAKGIGLAANQVGEHLQLFMIGYTPKQIDPVDPEVKNSDNERKRKIEEVPYQVFINPRITNTSEERVAFWHACLSAEGKPFGRVATYKWIEYESYDQTGKLITGKLDGMAAIIFQHEFRHLLGTLYLDHATDFLELEELKQKLVSGEVKELEEVDSGVPLLLSGYKIGDTIG